MLATQHAPLAAISPVTLYKILMLRTEVFVHEQRIVDEPELDGVDLEPFTELYWIEEDDSVVATLRLITEGDTATSAELPHHARLVAVDSRALSSRPLCPRPPPTSRSQHRRILKIGMGGSDSRARGRTTSRLGSIIFLCGGRAAAATNDLMVSTAIYAVETTKLRTAG